MIGCASCAIFNVTDLLTVVCFALTVSLTYRVAVGPPAADREMIFWPLTAVPQSHQNLSAWTGLILSAIKLSRSWRIGYWRSSS